MNSNQKKIDIVIPVLNEEKTLEENVMKLQRYLSGNCTTVTWKIVIADNGSTDRTAQLGEQLAADNTAIELVKVPERGVGLALKTAWSASDADFVGYMDLDLATGLNHFNEAVDKLLAGYQLVYGTRLHQDSKVVGRTLKREIVSRIFNRIIKSYLRIHFSDGMCGFKFLHRNIIADLMEGGAQSNGWFFSTELLTVAEWQGKKLYELPVTWTDDADSRVKIISLARQYIKQMRRLKKNRKQNIKR